MVRLSPIPVLLCLLVGPCLLIGQVSPVAGQSVRHVDKTRGHTPAVPPAPPLRAATLRAAALHPIAANPAPAGPISSTDVLGLIRAGQWPQADDAASHLADPVARKLVLWYRLLSPGAASLTEIIDFMADSPDWPSQGQLSRRREDALAAEPDDGLVLAACDHFPPSTAPALMRCAEVLGRANRPEDATTDLRRAWIGGITDAASETRFMARFAGTITADDQWRRFDHLVGQDHPDSQTVARQILRLDEPHRQVAETVVALRRSDARAGDMLAAVAPALARDPTLVLEEARWLRRANQDDTELNLWKTAGAAAQAAAPAEHLPAFWTERHMLARLRLKEGDNAGAYALVAGHGQTDPEQAADAEFLAGWIALRRLNDPARALPHFQRLAGLSGAAITQGRAHYWLARTAAARGDATAAHQEYVNAAAWPTTYYGQLAAVALGDGPAALMARINALRDPHWDDQHALEFAGREVARAAALLVSWGEPDRARPFLTRLEDVAPESADRAMAARLALGFGLTDFAVTIARRAGRDGVMLPDIGWPMPFEPPAHTIDPALTLGLIRQESNFSVGVVSPVGARGLMQLMPSTATAVARQLGTRVDVMALTSDPDANMRLGTAYMDGLLAQFGGWAPMAIAAYNAGPGRVVQWLADYGDPRGIVTPPMVQQIAATAPPGTAARFDMVDWIELIPFNETRNYVQRVIENMTIYRARRNQPAASAVWQPLDAGTAAAVLTADAPHG